MLGLLAIGVKTASSYSQQIPPTSVAAGAVAGTGRVSANSSSPNPTYLQDVLPIFMGKCLRCHNDQTRFLLNWTDYKAAFDNRWKIKRRVWDSWKGRYYQEAMPIANSPESHAMTEEERRLIKDWVETGAVYGVPSAAGGPESKNERMERGQRLFATICAACHQASARGIPNRFPPLAGSDFLNADKNRAIRTLLHGRQGEITVNGNKFNNSMPSFPLSDEDIANVLTFVYNSFGNSGKEVTLEEVQALRAQKEQMESPSKAKVVPSRPHRKSPWE